MFLLPMILSGILAIASIFVAFRLRPVKPSRVALAMAVLSPVLMLVLFYSLAFHLYHHLGGWPTSIGDKGFPPLLVTHEDIAIKYFIILLLLSIFIWPTAYILCAVIRRWRMGLFYLEIYALAYLVCIGIMWFAPSQFWNWWWD